MSCRAVACYVVSCIHMTGATQGEAAAGGYAQGGGISSSRPTAGGAAQHEGYAGGCVVVWMG